MLRSVRIIGLSSLSEDCEFLSGPDDHKGAFQILNPQLTE
mgnify:CR=1 FL=1